MKVNSVVLTLALWRIQPGLTGLNTPSPLTTILQVEFMQ